jgi:hypothetical protein
VTTTSMIERAATRLLDCADERAADRPLTDEWQELDLATAARAAMNLPGTSLDPHGPVAFWGYGQGGGTTAAAVELVPTYAPDLHVVGAFSGASPADLTLLDPSIDRSIYVGVSASCSMGSPAHTSRPPRGSCHRSPMPVRTSTTGQRPNVWART